MNEYYDSGQVFIPSRLTVQELGEKWLEEIALPGRSPHTKDLKIRTFKRISGPLGRLPVSSVSPRQIEAVYNKYRLDNYSQTILWQLAGMFRALFTYAQKMRLIAKNPVNSVDFQKSLKARATRHAYTAEELQDMLDMFPISDHRRLPLAIAIYTGAREAEIAGLYVSDDDSKSLTISKNIQNVPGGTWYLGPTKTRKTRVVTYGESLRKEIEIAREQIELRKVALGKTYKTPYADGDVVRTDWKKGTAIDLLCPYWDGRPLGRNTFKSISDRIVAKYPDFTFHQLRHSHCSLLIANGESPVEVATRLGHATTVTTMSVYAHSMLAKQKGLADAVEKIMKNQDES